MKIFGVLLMMIPCLALAQAPRGQMDEAQMFQQMKGMMLPMLEKSIPAMEKTHACIQESQNSADLEGCVEIMQAFQQEMARMTGRPAGGPHGQGNKEEKLDIEWSQELKTKMLAGIDQSLKASKAAKACWDASASGEAMQGCMEQAGFAKPQRRR